MYAVKAMKMFHSFIFYKILLLELFVMVTKGKITRVVTRIVGGHEAKPRKLESNIFFHFMN